MPTTMGKKKSLQKAWSAWTATGLMSSATSTEREQDGSVGGDAGRGHDAAAERDHRQHAGAVLTLAGAPRRRLAAKKTSETAPRLATTLAIMFRLSLSL